MRTRSKIAAVLLLAALTASCWAAQQFIPFAQLSEHPMGCHEHGKSSPQQSSPHKMPLHDCCLTGHDAAIPQLSTVERPPAECCQHLGLPSASSPALPILSVLNCSSIFSPESPGTTPLRV
ncbi:MAG: hypothetical protein WA609_08495 [Terriglobales bacterium]